MGLCYSDKTASLIICHLCACDLILNVGMGWGNLVTNLVIYGQWCGPVVCDKFNTLRPRQNGRHFAGDTFKRIFLKENVRISIKISLKFVSKSPIDNIPALFQIMAWRRPGDKPLSEAMMVSLLTHICVARPQWVIQRKHVLETMFMYNTIHESDVETQITLRTKRNHQLELYCWPWNLCR